MKREIIHTKDGSTSIYLPDWNETYHSKFGAIQEAYHVFIKNGLDLFNANQISILEIGFGTGLNAFITFLEAHKANKTIEYVGVEGYPIAFKEALEMNFVKELDAHASATIFEKLHIADWEQQISISDKFLLTKRQQFFQDISDDNKYDLIYFDAFGYRVQPDLWSLEIFQIMFKALKSEGVLVTYACRTSIKNAMLESGFQIEKLPGAPGKREMLRATKKL